MMEVNRCSLKRMTNNNRYVEQGDTSIYSSSFTEEGKTTMVLANGYKESYVSFVLGNYATWAFDENKYPVVTLQFYDEALASRTFSFSLKRDEYYADNNTGNSVNYKTKGFGFRPGDNKYLIHTVDTDDGIHIDMQENDSKKISVDFVGKHGVLHSLVFILEAKRLSDIIVSDFEQKMADYLVDIPVVSIDGWTKETDGSYSTDKMNVPLTFSFDREALQKIEKENTLKGCYLQADTTIRGDNMKNFVLNVGGETVTQAVGSQTTNVSFGTALSDIQKFTSTAPTLTVTG